MISMDGEALVGMPRNVNTKSFWLFVEDNAQNGNASRGCVEVIMYRQYIVSLIFRRKFCYFFALHVGHNTHTICSHIKVMTDLI